MNKTLDILPGEEEIQTITKKRVRRECDNCGEPAHYKYTFLLPNFRSNPASNAYGKDDCTWCSDAEQYSCRDPECQRAMSRLDGYSGCSIFPASEGFAHMFLYWEEVKGKGE